MHVKLAKLINNRRTIRAFNEQPVSKEMMSNIIEQAKYCPTGGNMQPWNIVALTGESKQKLAQKLFTAFDQQVLPNPDYQYYPEEHFEPYASRRHYSGMALYHASGIEFNTERVEWEKVRQLVRRNYDFFGAPIGLIFYLDKRLAEGSYLDLGMFMQNIVLLSESSGLSTCTQASIANYPDIIRTHLELDNNVRIMCGMGVGYADKEAGINKANIAKAPTQNFLKWLHD